MSKLKFQYSSYDLEFTQPFTTSKGEHNSRKGFLIVLTDDKGRRGFGEAAPFPEFGSETYEEAEEKLATLKFNLKIDFNDLSESIELNLREYNNYPAVKHGLEQAILKLLCVQRNLSLNELINRESRKVIPVNASIGFLSPAGTLKKAEEYIKQGYSTIKLKGGREKFSEDLDRIRLLHTEFGNDVKLRIDINGKWNLKEAENNLKRFEHFNIEYAEEPVSGLDNLKKLAKNTNVPVAPDESIRNYDQAVSFIDEGVSPFIILKPMMIGGLLPVLRIIEYARGKNVKPVITTSMDTAVGRAFAVFAASTVEHDSAHGLGTAVYFKNDVTKDPYPVKDGKIVL